MFSSVECSSTSISRADLSGIAGSRKNGVCSLPSHSIHLSRTPVPITINPILMTVLWPLNSLALVFYQEQVAKRVRSSIHRLSEPNGHLFLRRPFQIGWFVSQVSTYVFSQPSLIHTSFLFPSPLNYPRLRYISHRV